MKGNLGTLAFATVLAVVCAGLLTAASHVLESRQKANAEAERWRNIFDVLDVRLDPNDARQIARERLGEGAAPEALAAEQARVTEPAQLTAGELVRVAGRRIREREVSGLAIYEYRHPEAGLLRAFEFEGPGLWKPIKGLLCLRSDLRTIFRISFYEHEETPGLGGQIESPEFRRRFEDKTIAAPSAAPGVRIVRPGRAARDNEVDGISGATMTSDKVEAMLNHLCRRILENRAEVLREAGHGE